MMNGTQENANVHYELVDGFDDEPHEPSVEEITDVAPRNTDSANADAIVLEHGKGYRYVLEWGSWLAWSGKRWEMQGAAGMQQHDHECRHEADTSQCRELGATGACGRRGHIPRRNRCRMRRATRTLRTSQTMRRAVARIRGRNSTCTLLTP